MCISRNSAHSLQIIQRSTLAGKKHTDVSTYYSQKLFILYLIAVFCVKFYLCCLIQKLENTLKYTQSGNNSILLANQLYFSLFSVSHNGICSNILAADIFL